MIYYKMKAQEWSQQFSHYKSMGIFEDAQGQLSSVAGLIWPNFEPIQAFIVDLVTCKNKKIQSKMKVLEWSQHYPSIF